jgi:hypothetical protein
MSTQHRPLPGFWIGGLPGPGDRRPRTEQMPPGDVIMYQRADDGEWCHCIQDCFADAEIASVLAQAVPQHRRELTRRFTRRRDRELAMLAAATPRQLALTWGDFWRWEGMGGLTCYGWIQPLGSMMTEEYAACIKLGVPAADAWAEVQHRVDNIRENYTRGWRAGVGWSVVEPGGETGYSHVSLLTPISAAAFATARGRGWRPDAVDMAESLALAATAGRHREVTTERRLTPSGYEAEVLGRLRTWLAQGLIPGCPHERTAPGLMWFPVPGCPVGCHPCVTAWTLATLAGTDADRACDICGLPADGKEERSMIFGAGDDGEQAITITYHVCPACAAAEPS